MEQPPHFKRGGGPWLGFFLAFLVGGLLSLPPEAAIYYGIMPAVGNQTWVAWIFINPLLISVFEVLSMMIVSYLVLGMVPNRRYGFVMGAMAGLGSGLSIIPFNLSPNNTFFWFFMLPIEHMVLATFLGIGVFALVAKGATSEGFVNSLKGVPLMFFFIFWIFITIYWGMRSALTNISNYWVPYLLLPLYLFFLRDFLGGHLTFKTFSNRYLSLALHPSLKAHYCHRRLHSLNHERAG